ncbi:MAG: terminase large subunit [Clostridia bacterium]|nr:terminase large subunit [Clostridia bacterium]
MNDENAILAYYQGIRDGSIVVGKWIRLLYELILDGLEDKRWFFDQRKASIVIRFIERFCHHYKGSMAPDRIKLMLFQRAAFSLMFGIVDGDGMRQFTECLYVKGRKCGKTIEAAGAGTYFAYAGGEFGSEIYFLAPKLAQADLAYSSLEFNVDHEPDLKKRTKSTKSRGLYIAETNTTIQKLPFSDKKSDGYNPMFWVADEVSSWIGDRGLKQWEVMVSGTGARREPFGLAISSAGYENDGLYDELFRRGTAFLNGNSREQHLLPILYTIDDLDKWDDINELRKSLPGLGETVSVKFILKEIDTAHESLSKKREFITKYCNIKQNSSAAWLTAQDVNKVFSETGKTLEDFRHTYALAGIDLSITTDLTATVVLIQKGETVWFFTRFYMPRNKVDEATARDGIPYRKYIEQGYLIPSGDNVVDYHDVEKFYTELVRKYEILPQKTGYDRYSAAYLVQNLEGQGFHMESVSQGSNLTGVIIDVEGMIRDGRLKSAEDNNLMKIHMMDSALQTYEDNRRRLVKVSSTAHIDGMAALLDAMTMRRNYYTEMEHLLRNERG